MGIRFEKDSRRATNGPLIFFSILKDETFAEEIRGAFISGLSFYAYRFPNDNMMTFGSSESYIEGIGTPGFVIGMFNPELPFITIPYKASIPSSHPLALPSPFYTFPKHSTSFEQYTGEVETFIKKLKGQPDSKIVAARVLIKEASFDIAEHFYKFCEKFPDAFVFCFSTPATGCWIGASPELLLKGSGEYLSSMALAGTRKADTCTPWDTKNILEQKIVTDYIKEIFRVNGLNPEVNQTFTKVTGRIQHICTPIYAKISEDTKLDFRSLLKSLYPTPALCGYPKDFAMREILKLENFDRGCYGGFCGPFRSIHDFHFNVVLRCASVTEKEICIYAGGGITENSSVIAEWEETNLKILNTFG